MPASDPEQSRKPKRKAMFLGPQALDDLATTSARRRTEREAMEEALALLAERDRQRDAMADFVEAVRLEHGDATPEETAGADHLYERYKKLKATR
jgi:hypothetical protein